MSSSKPQPSPWREIAKAVAQRVAVYLAVRLVISAIERRSSTAA